MSGHELKDDPADASEARPEFPAHIINFFTRDGGGSMAVHRPELPDVAEDEGPNP